MSLSPDCSGISCLPAGLENKHVNAAEIELCTLRPIYSSTTQIGLKGADKPDEAVFLGRQMSNPNLICRSKLNYTWNDEPITAGTHLDECSHRDKTPELNPWPAPLPSPSLPAPPLGRCSVRSYQVAAGSCKCCSNSRRLSHRACLLAVTVFMQPLLFVATKIFQFVDSCREKIYFICHYTTTVCLIILQESKSTFLATTWMTNVINVFIFPLPW